MKGLIFTFGAVFFAGTSLGLWLHTEVPRLVPIAATIFVSVFAIRAWRSGVAVDDLGLTARYDVGWKRAEWSQIDEISNRHWSHGICAHKRDGGCVPLFVSGPFRADKQLAIAVELDRLLEQHNHPDGGTGQPS